MSAQTIGDLCICLVVGCAAATFTMLYLAAKHAPILLDAEPSLDEEIHALLLAADRARGLARDERWKP